MTDNGNCTVSSPSLTLFDSDDTVGFQLQMSKMDVTACIPVEFCFC